MIGRESMTLMVTACRAEALDVMSIELRDPLGGTLPAFEPGAHLEISVPHVDGASEWVRHYSLCNSAAETDRYVVAVGRTDAGRGGSQAVHERVRVGTKLAVRAPRNNFPLVGDAQHYGFVAGGIGITPILSMIHWCESHAKDWTLLYCARSRLRAPFYESLLPHGSKVRFHFDDEAHGAHLDIERELRTVRENEHIYCCGPQPMMHAVRAACGTRPPGSVHFEWFSAAGESASDASSENKPFKVVLNSTRQAIAVGANESILDALEQQGFNVPFACREGLCGSCETRLCDGEADHRDYVLSAGERVAQKSIMICVSRALSDELVLDL